jgi:hypothetical protein
VRDQLLVIDPKSQTIVVQDQLRVIQREQEGEGKKELGKKNMTLHQLQDAKFENNRLVEEMAAMRSRCSPPAHFWMRCIYPLFMWMIW